MFFLKQIKNLLKILLHLFFVIQILLTFLVFLTATYWFFSLAGIIIFPFLNSLVVMITEFVSLFYTPNIGIDGMVVDGSLFIFDVISLVIIYVISKLKYYIEILISEIDAIIYKLRKFDEDNLNRELKQETEEKILKSNNAAFLIDFDIKDMLSKSYISFHKEVRDKEAKEEYVLSLFCTLAKKNKNYEVRREERRIQVILKDFSKVDDFIKFIEEFVSNVQKTLKEEKWEINFYISAEVFENIADYNKNVYPSLNKLIRLKQKNKVVCFGSFNLRYQLGEKSKYYVMQVDGTYAIDGGVDVYVMLNKN